MRSVVSWRLIVRRGDSYGTGGADSESLQADVMRFMAIIAFCLIAVLALVRNAESEPAVSDTRPTVTAEPVQEAAVPDVATTAQRPEPARAAAIRVVRPQIPPAIDQPAAPERPDAPHAPAVPEPVLQPTLPERAAEPGLSLRFVSDGDFLRLIARGVVQVYAIRSDAVYELGDDYRFRAAAAPSQIYELQPATIPALVSRAYGEVGGDRGDAAAVTWGVSLPAAMQARIRSYVDQVDAGVLLIDRYSEVRYVATG